MNHDFGARAAGLRDGDLAVDVAEVEALSSVQCRREPIVGRGGAGFGRVALWSRGASAPLGAGRRDQPGGEGGGKQKVGPHHERPWLNEYLARSSDRSDVPCSPKGCSGPEPNPGDIMSTLVDRRGFVAACAAIGLPLDFSHRLWAESTGGAPAEGAVALDPITKEQIAAAENVLGLSWRDKDREMMLPTLQRALAGYTALHALPLPNSVPPAFHFDPVPVGKVPVGQPRRPVRAPRPAAAVKRPATESDWAYAGVADAQQADPFAGGHFSPTGRTVARPDREVHAGAAVRDHGNQGACTRTGRSDGCRGEGREVSWAAARHSLRRQGSVRSTPGIRRPGARRSTRIRCST